MHHDPKKFWSHDPKKYDPIREWVVELHDDPLEKPGVPPPQELCAVAVECAVAAECAAEAEAEGHHHPCVAP